MSSLVSVVFNLELSLIIGVITSFVLGSLLLLIKAPNTEYSRKIGKTKNTIAICFYICSILFYVCLRYSGVGDYEIFSSMMMFVVNAVASAVLSFSLINLLDETYIENDKFYLNVGIIAVVSIVFMKSFWWEEGWIRTAVRIAVIALFVIQCVVHILVFNKAFVKRLKQVEAYYDEEEDYRMKWIRFCYVIMMLTQMFILVYMLLPRGFMKIYNIWYSIFLLYFTANFISFLGSHKLLLDAFAYKTLSGHDLMQKIAENKSRRKTVKDNSQEPSVIISEADIRRLERSIDQWVKQKKYCEYDKSREEVAKELRTTKEHLHIYFSTIKGVDFKTWRTELRVEEAKKLLLENKEVSTNIIGEAAGFSDRSNFHRQFVKIVGCSPKQWRESDGRPVQS